MTKEEIAQVTADLAWRDERRRLLDYEWRLAVTIQSDSTVPAVFQPWVILYDERPSGCQRPRTVLFTPVQARALAELLIREAECAEQSAAAFEAIELEENDERSQT